MIPTRLPPAHSAKICEIERSRRARYDAHLRELGSDLGVELTWSPTMSLIGATVVVAVIALRLAGPAAAVVGASTIIASPLMLARIAQSRRRRRHVQQLPGRCGAMARSIRSGVPLALVLAELGDDDGCAVGLRRVGAQVARGRPVNDALADLAAGDTEESIAMLASALLLAEERGGDAAICLDTAGDAIRADLAAAERRRVAVAQSLLSARVLAALPIVFALLVSTARDGPAFDGRIGVFAVSAGVLLNVTGMFWMHALIGRMR